MSTFPTLRLGVLQSLIDLRRDLNTNPELFTSKECPYDTDTVQALSRIFEKITVEKIVEKEVVREVARGRPTEKSVKLTAEDEAMIEVSATELLGQLKDLGLDSDGKEKGLDTQTKIQIIKTKASLIEQLVKLRERWFNLKRVSVFQSTVISILDDLVKEDDRAEFLKRIEPYRD